MISFNCGSLYCRSPRLPSLLFEDTEGSTTAVDSPPGQEDYFYPAQLAIGTEHQPACSSYQVDCKSLDTLPGVPNPTGLTSQKDEAYSTGTSRLHGQRIHHNDDHTDSVESAKWPTQLLEPPVRSHHSFAHVVEESYLHKLQGEQSHRPASMPKLHPSQHQKHLFPAENHGQTPEKASVSSFFS